jgi:hypothetical protein
MEKEKNAFSMNNLPSKVLHEPQLDTILMVEKTILDSDDYPTRMELWRRLPRKVQYQTFGRILDYRGVHNLSPVRLFSLYGSL